MWPFRKRPAPEARQEITDAGVIFARAYQQSNIYGATPAELVAVLESPESAGEVRREARYLARSCAFFGSYLRVMRRGVLPGLMEPLDVSPETAAWWRRYWRGPVAVAGMTGLQFEALALRTYIVDGELFLNWRGRDDALEIITADSVECTATGGDDDCPWPRTWKIRGHVMAHKDVTQIANRDDPGTVRGRSLLARALPYARAVVGMQAHAGQSGDIMARFAAVLEAAGAAGLALLPSGNPLIGSTGLDAPAGEAQDDTAQVRRQFPAGSLPALPGGSKLHQTMYGMPDDARGQVDQLKSEIAAALGISRYALDGDTKNANFSSLRHGHRRDEDAFADWCEWWCETFRLPVWRRAVTAAIAGGELGAGAIMETPRWPAPYLTPPLPEMDAKALSALKELGMVDLETERIRRGLPRGLEPMGVET
ncbi:MAG: phage portal protein [Deltaproteobacteria bacterium]|nr:phage portal protein [Deltaproteobacteria bacterium]